MIHNRCTTKEMTARYLLWILCYLIDCMGRVRVEEIFKITTNEGAPEEARTKEMGMQVD